MKTKNISGIPRSDFLAIPVDRGNINQPAAST